MKASKYNIYVEESGRSFVFNQLTSAFSELDNDLFDAVRNNALDNIDNEEKEFLTQSNFICDEELVLLQRNRIMRYGNHSARITIMPTLNCNFRCWYCYETYQKGKMDKQMISRTIQFVKKNNHKFKWIYIFAHLKSLPY